MRSGFRTGGKQRGVWFTAEDILQIGRILPELMSPRQFGHQAGPPDAAPPTAALVAPARPEPSVEQFAQWAQLTAHRPSVRRSTSRR